jgi:DNA repair protein RadC
MMRKSIKKFTIHTERVKLSDASVEYRRKIRSSRDVYHIAKQLLDHDDQEVLLGFMLNVRQHLIGYAEIVRGGASSVSFDPAVAFRHAIHLAAHSVIFVHNHPSGDPSPSDQDVAITDRLCRAGEVISIQVQDHIIIGCGEEGYFSFLDAGLLGMGAIDGTRT